MSTFVPTPSPVLPGTAAAPFTNANLNPYGSNYATAFTYDESKLIEASIEYEIFDAVPAKYKALQVLLANPMIEKPLDEFSFLEKTFGRTAPISNAIVGAPGAQNMTFNLRGTFANIQDLPIVVGDVLTHPNGQSVIVHTITYNPGLNLTTVRVDSQTGGANLGALAAGDTFAIQAPFVADGMNYFQHYDRMTTVERYNYIQLFLRASRWSRIELQKMLNAGTTDYLSKDRREKIDQLRTDLYVSMFNGERGEFSFAAPTPGTSYYGKAMGGLFPTMVAAGSQHSSVPIAGFTGAFETLAFATDYLKDGGVRLIFGTSEMLYEVSKLWKQPGIRYRPEDKVGDLNLEEYKLGTMRFLPVPCELFRESSTFPATWKNKVIVVDPNSINPVKMQNIPYIEMGVTDNISRGTREDYEDWWVRANLGMRHSNPLAGFYIDVI